MSRIFTIDAHACALARFVLLFLLTVPCRCPVDARAREKRGGRGMVPVSPVAVELTLDHSQLGLEFRGLAVARAVRAARKKDRMWSSAGGWRVECRKRIPRWILVMRVADLRPNLVWRVLGVSRRPQKGACEMCCHRLKMMSGCEGLLLSEQLGCVRRFTGGIVVIIQLLRNLERHGR
jgi:hypothetical protein